VSSGPEVVSQLRENHPTLIERAAEAPKRCRCGTRLASGRRVLELFGLPDTLAPIFRGRYFCSARCARAEILETFETLEGVVNLPAGEMITDLRQVYADLGRAFAAMLP